MQLNSFTDYGLRALIYLACLPPGELTNSAQICRVYNLSQNHMIKIVHKLGKWGLIETVRGKYGGIRLGKPAKEIIIGDVIRKLEPMTLLNCSPEACHITPSCRLKGALAGAMRKFMEELDQYTLADMVDGNDSLYPLLALPLRTESL